MTEEYGHIPDGFFLSEKEIEDLRKSKKQLTEYGKRRLKELAKEGISKYNEALQLMRNQEPYPDEMFEEAERREKSNRVLQRYNDFYNLETSGMPQGMPITMEHMQIITLQSAIDALRCENLNREYNEIAISDIEDLIERLDEQATAFLERVRKLKND